MTTAATPNDLASDALVAQMSSRNEQLSSENRRLTDENRRLREQVAELEDAIGQLKSAAEARVAALVGALREVRESFRVQCNANDPRNGPAADSLGRRIAEVALARIDRALAGVEPASFDPLKCQRIPPSLLGTTGHVGDVLREALEELPDTHDRLGWIYVRCIREALRRLDACTPEPAPPAVTREQVEREIADWITSCPREMATEGLHSLRGWISFINGRIRSGAYRSSGTAVGGAGERALGEGETQVGPGPVAPAAAPAETDHDDGLDGWCLACLGSGVPHTCPSFSLREAAGAPRPTNCFSGGAKRPRTVVVDKPAAPQVTGSPQTVDPRDHENTVSEERYEADMHASAGDDGGPAPSAPPCDECHGAGMVDHDVVGGDGSWGCSACNGTGVAPSAPEQAEPTSDPDMDAVLAMSVDECKTELRAAGIDPVAVVARGLATVAKARRGGTITTSEVLVDCMRRLQRWDAADDGTDEQCVADLRALLDLVTPTEEPRPSGDVRCDIADAMQREIDSNERIHGRQANQERYSTWKARSDLLAAWQDRIRTWPLPAPQSAAPSDEVPEGWRRLKVGGPQSGLLTHPRWPHHVHTIEEARAITRDDFWNPAEPDDSENTAAPGADALTELATTWEHSAAALVDDGSPFVACAWRQAAMELRRALASAPATPQGAAPGLPALPDGWLEERVATGSPMAMYRHYESGCEVNVDRRDGEVSVYTEDPLTAAELHAVLSHHLGIAPPDPGKVSEAVALLRDAYQRDSDAGDDIGILRRALVDALRLLAPEEG